MTKSIKQNASNAIISSVSIVNFEHLITGWAIACILHQRMNESFIKKIDNGSHEIRNLSFHQNGFMNGCSTKTQLLRYLDKCI